MLRFYFYLGEAKINSLYNECVERTEIEKRELTSARAHGKALAKLRLTLGQLLKSLGLGSMESAVGVELGGELASSKEVVTKLMAEQKLMIVEARATRDQGTLDLVKTFETVVSSQKSLFCALEIPMQLDAEATPVEKIKEGVAPVLSGTAAGINVRIRASVREMRTPETWQRFIDHPQPAGVFGRLTYASPADRVAEIQPVAMYWA
ncbi:MAG: hypothetical protein KAY32_16610 [Candidatus Eisenbacteria sp.]|nr:hypothetical protein [Candidatus Eisenbacteria bacterium]